ncbi:MAG: S41 family peptidase [Prevotella sp.]|jgi:carboxyl-terminal processing protease|nr:MULTISPECIES: S41 family peptidase [unclassified Prevotella]MCH3969739.1 S41 family peptidase [Prevotella sp.]MCH3992676.1 S41 family peptidase [Prevotella sp.]MCH4186649.1 S41 family peptidase [Prevotella sp.]MCH4216643.1 S41 family peptidase [Prevotella sp.]MCH4251977.1 S41 family peptidase [Prevotella sp.]
MKKLVLAIFMAAVLPAAAQTGTSEDNHAFDVSKNMEIFTDIYKYLDLMYVDTLNANEVIGNGINAMLKSLDPYTVYYPENQVKDLKQLLTGKYAGIGAIVRLNNQNHHIIIDEPYEGMPAALAGLKRGDEILSIDDSSMIGKDVQYVSNHLRGDPGTSFLLKVKRPSTGKTMKFKIVRKSVQLPSLPYYGMQANDIAYMNLSSFTDQCSKDVRRAFINFRKQGAKGLILDLRNNGGGSLQEAVNIVNMFVPKGITLVKTIGKLKQANHEYKTTVEPIDTVMPIIVLVNGNTASASEITCGSLQDLDRAVILGTRTYGKGLVQLPVDIAYNGQLKLTTARYYIPSGRCIQAINYKHANGGYTEHVPDSLTHVFHTLHGRLVRDGGGIQPDVVLESDSLPNIAFYLAAGRDSNEVLLNYELDYIARHPTIAPPDKFQLTDADYDNFKQRVLQCHFTYDHETENYLKNLEKLAKFEGYYNDAKPEFAALEKKLKHNVAKDLDFNREAIKQLIENDIVTAYYYQRGGIENALRTDKQMQAAMKLIQNPESYKKLLQPKKK